MLNPDGGLFVKRPGRGSTAWGNLQRVRNAAENAAQLHATDTVDMAGLLNAPCGYDPIVSSSAKCAMVRPPPCSRHGMPVIRTGPPPSTPTMYFQPCDG